MWQASTGDSNAVTEVRVETLGGLRLTIGEEPCELRARKVKALFARLLLAREADLPRTQLANLLWSNSGIEQARQSLRQALTDLRRDLGPVAEQLHADAKSVRLDTATWSVDFHNLERYLNDASVATKVRGVETYHGVLFEGLELAEAGFEDWLQQERRELQERVLSVATKLIDDIEEPETALAIAKRVVAWDPLNENAHRDVMMLAIGCGQDSVAIKQYMNCRALLRRELDIEPEAATTTLYENLIAHRQQKPDKNQDRGQPRGQEKEADVVATPAGEPKPQLRHCAVLAVRAEYSASDPEQAAEQRRFDTQALSKLAAGCGGKLVSGSATIPLLAFGLTRATGFEIDRAYLAGQAFLSESGCSTAALGIAVGALMVEADELVSGSPVDEAIARAHAAQLGQVELTDEAKLGRRIGGDQVVDIVGREHELRQFVATLDTARECASGYSLLVRGEAGIGKTRLVEDWRALALAAGYQCHVAHVLDFGARRGTDALSQITQSLLSNIDISEVPSSHLPHIRDLLGETLTEDENTHIESLGPAQRLASRVESLRWLIQTCVATAPLYFLVEDIHWADRLTMAVLAQLAQQMADLPIVLAMTMREEGEPLDPRWRAAMHGVALVTMNLRKLRSSEARTLALKCGAQPDQVTQVVARAGGNPLFIQQLARSASQSAGLPESLQTVIASRLDALPPGALNTIRAASVLGQVFDEQTLTEMLGGEPQLAPLVESGLVRQQAESWRFHHALVRDGVYHGLLASERRALHEHAAELLQSKDAVLYAEHLVACDSPNAGSALLQAARSEFSRHRVARALDLAQQAVALDPESAEAALSLQAQAQLYLGDTHQARSTFVRLVELATTDAERSEALLGRGMCANQLDDSLAAIGDLTAAAELATDPERKALALFQLGNAYFPTGRIADCLNFHQQSLELANSIGSSLGAARAEGGLGDANYARGRMRTSLAHFGRCVGLAKAGGHTDLVPANLAMKATTRMYMNEFEAGLEEAYEAEVLASESQSPRSLLLASNIRGLLCQYAGQLDTGLELANRIVALAHKIDSRRFLIDGGTQRAQALWGLKRIDEANTQIGAMLRALDNDLIPYAGAYVYGTAALLTNDAAQQDEYVALGAKMLPGAVSHCHLFFYVQALEGRIKLQRYDEIEELADAFVAYGAAEPLPFIDYHVERVRVISAWHLQGSSKALDARRQQLVNQGREMGQNFGFDGLLSLGKRG